MSGTPAKIGIIWIMFIIAVVGALSCLIAGALLLINGCSRSSPGNEEKVGITGHVQDSNGEPIQSVSILARNRANASVFTGHTDGSGNYALSVNPGAYDISAHAIAKEVSDEKITKVTQYIAQIHGPLIAPFTMDIVMDEVPAGMPLPRGLVELVSPDVISQYGSSISLATGQGNADGKYSIQLPEEKGDLPLTMHIRDEGGNLIEFVVMDKFQDRPPYFSFTVGGPDKTAYRAAEEPAEGWPQGGQRI